MRQLICGTVFILALFGIFALADGAVTVGTVVTCIGLLLTMAVCIVIGDDDLFEALMKPSKKENTYMERYRQRLDYAFGKKKNRR